VNFGILKVFTNKNGKKKLSAHQFKKKSEEAAALTWNKQ
jgi:hypothetical protein